MLQKEFSRWPIYALTHSLHQLFVIGMIVANDIEIWSLSSKCNKYLRCWNQKT